MNNDNKSSEVKTKNNTLKLICSWIFGVLFLITGIRYLVSQTIVGILFLLIAILFLPPVVTVIKQNLHIKLSGNIRIALIIVLFIISGILLPKPSLPQSVSVTPTTNNQVQAQVATTSINSTQPVSGNLSIGDFGYLYLPNNGTGSMVLATTKDNEDQFTKLANANDTEGISQMITSGQLFLVDQGTKVRLIDISFMSGSRARILDGQFYGQSGWVPEEFITRSLKDTLKK